MTLRRGCRWHHSWIPSDGLGPIRPGEEVSDGICESCAHLVELGLHVGKPNAWLRRVLLRIAQLEGDGRGPFGGTAVLAFWLCERCRPVKPMTRAKHAQIRRIAGSAENYGRLMRIAAGAGTPKRLQRGWVAADVTTYLAQRWAERKKERDDKPQEG